MNAWWRSRAPREQRLLVAGSIVAALLLTWAFVVYPQQRAHRAALEAVANSERDLAWMRQAAPTLRGQGTVVAASGSGRSFLAQVDATARAAGLGSAIGNVEPQPDGRVGVTFNDVSFDVLMRWLEPFAAQHGARIEAFSAQRTPANGLVDARLTLIEAGRG